MNILVVRSLFIAVVLLELLYSESLLGMSKCLLFSEEYLPVWYGPFCRLILFIYPRSYLPFWYGPFGDWSSSFLSKVLGPPGNFTTVFYRVISSFSVLVYRFTTFIVIFLACYRHRCLPWWSIFTIWNRGKITCESCFYLMLVLLDWLVCTVVKHVICSMSHS